MAVKKLIINEDNSGRRIDNYLLSIFNSLPRSKIYNIIRKGEVRVNSSRIKPSYRLEEGDLIRIPPNLDFTKPSSIKIDKKLIDKHTDNILFENRNYIITNKQNNISVHSDDIILNQQIRLVGEHEIIINPYTDVQDTIKILVVKN